MRLSRVRAAELALFTILVSTPAFASVESSLQAVKTALLVSILPLCALMGLGWAAFCFFTGSPNAKQYLAYAILGCGILFGAQAIVDFIQRNVR